jgi:hypothetical protein
MQAILLRIEAADRVSVAGDTLAASFGDTLAASLIELLPYG